jgi:hypothetical protein
VDSIRIQERYDYFYIDFRSSDLKQISILRLTCKLVAKPRDLVFLPPSASQKSRLKDRSIPAGYSILYLIKVYFTPHQPVSVGLERL